MRSLDYIVDDVSAFLTAVVARIPAGSILEFDRRLPSDASIPYELPRTGFLSSQRYEITEESRAIFGAVLSSLERPGFHVISLAVHGPTGTYFEAPHFFDGAHPPVLLVHAAFPGDLLDHLVIHGVVRLDPAELPRRSDASI